jgi:hypothetical protein
VLNRKPNVGLSGGNRMTDYHSIRTSVRSSAASKTDGFQAHKSVRFARREIKKGVRADSPPFIGLGLRNLQACISAKAQ